MRIGVDARELSGRPTGTGRYLRNLLRVWAQEGEDRLFVYFNGPPPQDPLLRDPSIVVRPLGVGPIRGVVWQERRLPAAAREDRLDVFFAPAYTCPLGLRLPKVTAVHDLSFFSVPWDFALVDGARRRSLVRASMRASRRILAISDFTRREIRALAPDLASRVIRVPPGADDDLPPTPSREVARVRLGVHGPLILAVGSIFNRRRLPVLLRAIARLSHRIPGVTLEVVGDNRTHPRIDLPALIRSLGLSDRVRLSGFVSEEQLAEAYCAADVAVALSEYEGFGLPALEAAVRGIPLVVSARPALGEEFAEAALLVDPQDPIGVAEAIERLLGDPGLGQRLAARGRKLAARHSWAAAASLTREALRQAAGE